MKKVLNHFFEYGGYYLGFLIGILFIFFLVSYTLYEDDFLVKYKDYIITIDNEQYYCDYIDFNNSSLVSSSKSYMSLHIDENKIINVRKTDFFTIETVVSSPEPTYFEWLIGDYDE